MNYRVLWRCLLAGGVVALSWGLPIRENPLMLPAAYAHHGGGGSSGGSSGGGGGGGKSSTIRQAPEQGYGKGGRGAQGMKP